MLIYIYMNYGSVRLRDLPCSHINWFRAYNGCIYACVVCMHMYVYVCFRDMYMFIVCHAATKTWLCAFVNCICVRDLYTYIHVHIHTYRLGIFVCMHDTCINTFIQIGISQSGCTVVHSLVFTLYSIPTHARIYAYMVACKYPCSVAHRHPSTPYIWRNKSVIQDQIHLATHIAPISSDMAHFGLIVLKKDMQESSSIFGITCGTAST